MPAHLFIGPNTYLKEEALGDLKFSLLKGGSCELNYKVFSILDEDFSRILEYINTIPFLSAHRMAVIKNIEEINTEDASRLVNYLKKPLKSTHLILDTDNDGDPAGCGELIRYVNIKRFDDLTDAGIRAWIKNFVRSASGDRKKISDDAVRELQELHGKNLFVLSNELEKLITFSGINAGITLDDVLEISGRSLASSAFDLTRAIERNRVDEALKVVSDLVMNGKKHYEIIGLLCWHLKKLLRAKVLQSNGQAVSGIARTMDISGRYHDEFFRQVKTLKASRIRSKLRALLEADLDIKKTRLDPMLALEFVIIKLCLGV